MGRGDDPTGNPAHAVSALSSFAPSGWLVIDEADEDEVDEHAATNNGRARRTTDAHLDCDATLRWCSIRNIPSASHSMSKIADRRPGWSPVRSAPETSGAREVPRLGG